MRKKLIYFIFISSFLIGCNKPELRSCWKFAGEDTQKEMSLIPFNQLKLTERLQFNLVQDSVEKVILKGGKNLLNFVELENVNGTLIVRNKNKCNFLRSYKKKIMVEIHFKELINIEYEGTEDLTNEGTLQFDWLTFLIRDGSGSVKLNFNAQALNAQISHGYGDFTFTGKVNQANLSIRSNGFCDTYGLQVMDSITVISNTQGMVMVNADGAKLKAQIDTDGSSIYYKGTPLSVVFNQYGNGSLIDVD
jgi:hypothetical protein